MFFFYNDNDYDLEYLYQNVRALIFPSLYEGFGLPLLEAMELGCPVLSSSGGSLKEIGGEGIMYFDPKNPESISETIEKLVFSESLIKENIKYGFKRVKLFSWEKCAKKTFNVYKQL